MSLPIVTSLEGFEGGYGIFDGVIDELVNPVVYIDKDSGDRLQMGIVLQADAPSATFVVFDTALNQFRNSSAYHAGDVAQIIAATGLELRVRTAMVADSVNKAMFTFRLVAA